MISIIVLHHNKFAYSHACLESLLLCDARPLEIINVDNGSRDETAQLLRDWHTRAREIGIESQALSFEENIGAIRGRNEAMKVARGEFVVFLDNDTLVAQRDWLDKMRDFLNEDKSRAVVAPKLLFPWAPFEIECCGAAVSPRGRIQYLGRGESRDSIAEPQRVQCAISAAWMTPRSAVEKIGLLDEIYSPVQYEDLDWCYRAREAAMEIWTLPSVEVFHFEHTTTSGSGDINFKYVTTKNGIEFKRRWQPHFSTENGPSEEQAQWRNLERQTIEDVDWRALLPR